MKSENTDSISKQIHTFATRARCTLLAVFLLTLAAGGTASALTINLTYDSDANLMAAGLTAQNIIDMKAACRVATSAQFTSRYNDPININIMVKAEAEHGSRGERSHL